MNRFTDNNGKEWSLDFTVGHSEELRGLGLDVYKIRKDPMEWVKLHEADYPDIIKWCYCICEKQVKEAGLTPKEFALCFLGSGMEVVVKTLSNAVVDFFPSEKTLKAIRDQLVLIWEEMKEKKTQEIMTILQK